LRQSASGEVAVSIVACDMVATAVCLGGAPGGGEASSGCAAGVGLSCIREGEDTGDPCYCFAGGRRSGVTVCRTVTPVPLYVDSIAVSPSGAPGGVASSSCAASVPHPAVAEGKDTRGIGDIS